MFLTLSSLSRLCNWCTPWFTLYPIEAPSSQVPAMLLLHIAHLAAPLPLPLLDHTCCRPPPISTRPYPPPILLPSTASRAHLGSQTEFVPLHLCIGLLPTDEPQLSPHLRVSHRRLGPRLPSVPAAAQHRRHQPHRSPLSIDPASTPWLPLCTTPTATGPSLLLDPLSIAPTALVS